MDVPELEKRQTGLLVGSDSGWFARAYFSPPASNTGLRHSMEQPSTAIRGVTWARTRPSLTGGPGIPVRPIPP